MTYAEFLEAIPVIGPFLPNEPTASDPVWARLDDNDARVEELVRAVDEDLADWWHDLCATEAE